MIISIVNYGMGNLRSVQGALSYLGFESELVSTPEQIQIGRASCRERV